MIVSTRLTRRTAVAVLAGATALLVAACSSGGARSGTGGGASPAGAQHATTPSPAAAAAGGSPATVTPHPLPAARTAVTRAATTPCTANTRAQYVYVSIRAQHMWLCARHQVALSTAVTTGMSGADTATPTGTFHIQGRNRNSVLTLDTGRQYDVKYWIPFQAPLYGFHDSSWQRFPYGSPQYRTDGSHGCVHMPLGAIAFLYRWVEIGATVRITA